MYKVIVPFNASTRCIITEKGYAPGFYACECAAMPIDDNRKLELGLFDDFDISGGKRVLSALLVRLWSRFIGLVWPSDVARA